jgi:hypothetical protein
METTTSPPTESAKKPWQKRPMKAPKDAIAPNMTGAEENRALDCILKGGKSRMGQQSNLEPE